MESSQIINAPKKRVIVTRFSGRFGDIVCAYNFALYFKKKGDEVCLLVFGLPNENYQKFLKKVITTKEVDIFVYPFLGDLIVDKIGHEKFSQADHVILVPSYKIYTAELIYIKNSLKENTKLQLILEYDMQILHSPSTSEISFINQMGLAETSAGIILKEDPPESFQTSAQKLSESMQDLLFSPSKEIEEYQKKRKLFYGYLNFNEEEVLNGIINHYPFIFLALKLSEKDEDKFGIDFILNTDPQQISNFKQGLIKYLNNFGISLESVNEKNNSTEIILTFKWKGENREKEIRVFFHPFISLEDTEILYKISEPFTGTTGDQSLGLAISFSKVFLYQTMSWKLMLENAFLVMVHRVCGANSDLFKFLCLAREINIFPNYLKEMSELLANNRIFNEAQQLSNYIRKNKSLFANEGLETLFKSNFDFNLVKVKENKENKENEETGYYCAESVSYYKFIMGQITLMYLSQKPSNKIHTRKSINKEIYRNLIEKNLSFNRYYISSENPRDYNELKSLSDHVIQFSTEKIEYDPNDFFIEKTISATKDFDLNNLSIEEYQLIQLFMKELGISDIAELREITQNLFEKTQEIQKRALEDLPNVLHNAGNIQEHIYFGKDINAKNDENETVLTVAIKRGDLERVKILIKIGADLNLPMGDKKTPLVIACQEGHLEIVKALLDSSKIDMNNDLNYSAFFSAAKDGNFTIVKQFLLKGVQILSYDIPLSQLEDIAGEKKELFKIFLQNKKISEHTIIVSASPFDFAKIADHQEIAFLLEVALDLEVYNNSQNTVHKMILTPKIQAFKELYKIVIGMDEGQAKQHIKEFLSFYNESQNYITSIIPTDLKSEMSSNVDRLYQDYVSSEKKDLSDLKNKLKSSYDTLNQLQKKSAI